MLKYMILLKLVFSILVRTTGSDMLRGRPDWVSRHVS
jgi:hypothetical protein